jgi:2-aminobenzoate-CoA ligase
MLDAVECEGVTVLWMIETMARMMLDDCDLAGADTGSLRVTMINEGTSATYDRWEDLVGVRPGNAFGMTPLRGHPLSSYRGGEKVAPGTSLGKPYRGYEVRVVSIEDPTEELGREEPGRLAVRGPTGITYWCNRHPELPGLMETDTHAGWSLLDDVFVRDDDGFLHFRSRMDDMINSAGRLISPVDVESVLREHGRVHDAAVVGVPHETRGEVVKAHVVPDGPVSDEAALTASLQAFVKERTAPYKYPREVEVVDRIPRDEVGKVRRRTLREGERD